MPTYPYPLTLVNPGAELGNTTGWTPLPQSDGVPGVLATPGSDNGADGSTHSGAYSFSASQNADHPAWGQVVDIPSDAWADIDAGLYWANATCYLKTWRDNSDYGRINVDCLDAGGGLLATGNGQYFSTNTAWQNVGAAVAAPAGTRKLRIWTNSQRTNRTQVDVYFDDFALQLIAPPDMNPATPHRFWQFVCDATNGDGSYCTLNQLLWYDASNNPVTSGSFSVNEYLGGYPPEGLLTNGDGLYCAMQNRGGQQWALYDLGAGNALAMSSVLVVSRQDGYLNQSPYNFRFQWSDDGATFYNFSKIERSGAWATNDQRRYYVAPGTRYRLVYYNQGGGAYFRSVELHATVGGPDITFPCDPSLGLAGLCSGDGYSAGAWVAFDDQGMNDNCIGNGSNDHWVEWICTTPSDIAEIVIAARQDYGYQAPSEIYVRRSDDNGLTYRSYAYIESGSFSNSQVKTFALSDWNTNIVVSKMGEYVVEGDPVGVKVSKMGEYVVEGMPKDNIAVTKMGEYVVEGPLPVYVTKLAAYVVEGPPAPGTFGPFVDPGGHRYWRLFNRRSHSDETWPVGITFMSLARSDGRSIVGFGGTANASSSAGDAPNAFTTDFNTMWQPSRSINSIASYGHGEWLSYDFGDGWTPRIDKVTLYPDKDNWVRTPFFFEMQYSDDGVNWATDWMVLYNGSYTYGQGTTFTRPVFTDERKGRFWALHALGWVTSAGATNFGGAEWGIMTEEDGTSIVQGRTSGAFCSSTSGGENLYNLFSGSNNDEWSSAAPTIGGAEYVAIDLGSTTSVEIRQITWTSRTDGYWFQSPTSGQMLRSMDGVSFQPLWQFSGVTWTTGGVTQTMKTPLPLAGTTHGRRRNGVTVVF